VEEKEYMIEIEDLKDRLCYIEREKIVNIEKDINQIKEGQVKTNTLVEKFTEAMDKQCDTMDVMAKSMQEMSLNMRDNNNSIETLNDKFTCFEGDMSELRNKVSTQENATWVFIKKNIWKITTLIGVASIIAYVVLGIGGF